MRLAETFVNQYPSFVSSVVKHPYQCLDLEFDYRTGQIRHLVVNHSPLLSAAMFLRSCVAQALSRGDGPDPAHYSLHTSAHKYNQDLTLNIHSFKNTSHGTELASI